MDSYNIHSFVSGFAHLIHRIYDKRPGLRDLDWGCNPVLNIGTRMVCWVHVE